MIRFYIESIRMPDGIMQRKFLAGLLALDASLSGMRYKVPYV